MATRLIILSFFFSFYSLDTIKNDKRRNKIQEVERRLVPLNKADF